MKKAVYAMVFVFALGCVFSSLAFAFQPPVVKLERVDVAGIQQFFAKPQVGYKSEKEPGKPMAVGAMMNLAYIFGITNPNKEPIMLDELTFTTEWEGFDVNMALVYEDSWIPAGKTNQVRVVVTNEALPTIGNLMVGTGNVTKLQEMKTTAGAMVKKWWDNIGDFGFPIKVTNGKAVFQDEKGKEQSVSFTGEWGGAPKK